MFDNNQNHNPTGKGGENPNPGEDAAHTARNHANKGDAVQIAQENAMWAVYDANRSAEKAKQEAEYLKAEILDGTPPQR